MWRNKIWGIWEEYFFIPVAVALWILGYLAHRFIRPYCSSPFLDDAIVALLIAGILTLAVDPFIKKLARREAARDIFHHILGYKLPPSIRERLEEIVRDTKLYREEVTKRIEMSEDGDFVVFDVEMEFFVVNPYRHDLGFEPLIQFENGERGKIKRIIHFGDTSYGQDAEAKPVGNLGASEYRGEPVLISSGNREEFKYEYRVMFPADLGFWFPNFVLPTIGLSLTIKHPDSFNVKATDTQVPCPEGEWKYPTKLWMQGEHIEIVWSKTNDPSK